MLTSFIEKGTHCSHRSKVTRDTWLRRQDSHGNNPEHSYICQSGAKRSKADACTHSDLFDSASHAGTFLPDVRDLLSTLRFEFGTFALGYGIHCRRHAATIGCPSIVTCFGLIA